MSIEEPSIKESSIRESEQEFDDARRRTVSTARLTALLGALGIPVMTAPALLLTRAVHASQGSYLIIIGWMVLLCLPLVLLIWRLNDSQMRRSNRAVRRAGEDLRELLDLAQADAARQQADSSQKEFETELANAMEMAEGEAEVLGVIEQAFSLVRPSDPVELLLADNSHAHLSRVARSPGGEHHIGCPVAAPDQCPAARRGQVQRFPDSERLGACPKLRAAVAGEGDPGDTSEPRPAPRRSAVCVPVSIMGRTVGVVHACGTVEEPPAESDVARLNTIASLAGGRLGMIRMVAEVELQAATDSLTGLLNRRAFETGLAARRREPGPVALALADLDHFKQLNDTYGHETGDRALRIFAQTVQESVRATDLVGRHGGEEFVIALMDCSADHAADIFEAMRARIEASAAKAGLPQFTASFGLVDVDRDEDLPTALARADRALFEAKRSGRNRVVQHLERVPAAPDASPVHALSDEDDEADSRDETAGAA